MGEIVKLQLNRIKMQVEARHKIPFDYSEDVVTLVVSRCTESASGERMIDAMLPDISKEFLTRMTEGKSIDKVPVDIVGQEFSYAFH